MIQSLTCPQNRSVDLVSPYLNDNNALHAAGFKSIECDCRCSSCFRALSSRARVLYACSCSCVYFSLNPSNASFVHVQPVTLVDLPGNGNCDVVDGTRHVICIPRNQRGDVRGTCAQYCRQFQNESATALTRRCRAFSYTNSGLPACKNNGRS